MLLKMSAEGIVLPVEILMVWLDRVDGMACEVLST